MFTFTPLRLAIVSSLSLGLFAGCAQERSLYGDLPRADDDRFSVTSPEGDDFLFDNPGLDRIERSRLEGTIGPRQNLNGTARVGGYEEAGYTSIDSTVTTPGGDAMTVIDFVGGVDHPALQAGKRYRFTADPFDEAALEPGFDEAPADLEVTALGCAESSPGSGYDFDTSAEVVDVEVSEGNEPGERELLVRTVVQGEESFTTLHVAGD